MPQRFVLKQWKRLCNWCRFKKSNKKHD